MAIYRFVFLFIIISLIIQCGKGQKQVLMPQDYNAQKLNIKIDSLTIANYEDVKLLIFESYFDDSISISCNNEFLYLEKIKTNRSLEAVYKTFDISLCKKEVKISFIDLKQTVLIKVINNFSYYYLNRSKNGTWYLNVTNELRKYK